jgi:hypothetical protein
MLCARRYRTAAEYIDRQGFEVLVNWKIYFEQPPGDCLEREWKPCPHPMYEENSMCLIRTHAP